jgi:hypothetical protein
MTAKPSQQRKSGAGKATVSETFDTMPLRYGDDPYVWACWLYYEDGMTQGRHCRRHGHLARDGQQLPRRGAGEEALSTFP